MEIKCTLPSKVNFLSTKIKLLYSTLLFLCWDWREWRVNLQVWTLWYPKEYLTNIFVAAEQQFRVHTGKEVCHKICVDKIVDILLQKPVLRSKWNMLVEECGCEITKGRAIIFLDQILSLFIKIRSFSYAKDIVQKYEIQQKATKKKGHESKYALLFHHFFHHQRIFEGLMQRMM